MNMKDLDLHFDVVCLAPLKLTGRCGETHFTITEVGTAYTTEVGRGYELTAADGSKEYFQTLKAVMQQCYLNWG